MDRARLQAGWRLANAAIRARTGARSASRSSIRRSATAATCAPAGDKPMSSPLTSKARARGSESRGQAGHALVEQRGMDPLRPRDMLLGQVPVQLQHRPQLAGLPRRDPRLRHPAVGHQSPQVPEVGLVGLRPLLRAARCAVSADTVGSVREVVARVLRVFASQASWRPHRTAF
jgi:hypothetical protein